MQIRTLATLLSTLLFSISACSSDECPSGTTDCNGTCVALSSDVNNCGACGNACGADEVCALGTCMDTGTTGCPVNLTDCNGTCVDTDADAANCGSCGNACTGGLVCAAGLCEVSCPGSQTECSGACFDTQNTAAHCGDCGAACPTGQLCVAGNCEATCPSGQEACGTECVSTATDEDHCGMCGVACAAGELCVGGNCELSCGGGSVACDGICTNTMTDLANCGGCGVQCDVDELCVAGNCALSCQGAQADCGGGTCTSTLTDEMNCGGCGTACGANELCNAGSCTLTCAGNAPDECAGVCTNTLVDPANCGGCGIACGTGEVCSAGNCQGQCGPGLAQCGTTCTSTLTDPLNCGGCGTACPTPTGGTAVCASGTCAGICAAGQADCDGDLSMSGTNGCEIDLANDAANCGTCGFACTYANAAAACNNFVCELGTCAAGFDNCDTNPATGCEAELAVDPMNCNACGNVCPAGNICSAGQCVSGQMTGEDCTGPLVLSAGAGTYAWAASNNDYLQLRPSCQSVSFTAEGPDVVLQYTPTFNGFADISIVKPANNRYTMVVSDATCGTLTELACVSDNTAAELFAMIPVVANTDYFVYVVDTDSGATVLPNPLEVTVNETNCGINPAPTVTALMPAVGAMATELSPDLVVTFDQPITETVGTITVTGNMGTNVTYDLATNPAEVDFNTAGDTITITGSIFAPGETVTVTWTGLVDALCSTPAAPATPAWSFTAFTPPCAPGFNGMVGTTQTRLSTGLGSFIEYYVAADNDPNGWVYAGGTSDVYRMSKNGATVEDVGTLAGLTASELGYAMVISGQNVYTIDSTTTGTTGRVFRITSDGGATWSVQDAVGFPTAPAEDIRGADAYGGLVYLITHEGTSSTPTEIWSFDPSTIPATAVLETSFSGYTSCGGLEIDMNYFYVVCGGGETVARVNRMTGAAEDLITNVYDLSNTAGALHGTDFDADGVIDYLYVQGWYEESYFICGLGVSNYNQLHIQFNTGANGNYGMGFDQTANSLWLIDDGSREFIRVD